MITFNNTIKSTLSEVEIKGKTVNGVSCGIDNGDGTFKITILTTNGLNASDGNYEECKQDLILPCKLGSVSGKTDVLRFDKAKNRFILEQNTNNGASALSTTVTYYIDTCLNVISYDGKTTIDVSSGTVSPTIKSTCPRTMLTSQKFIVNKIREIIGTITNQLNEITLLKKKDIDLQNQINSKSENTHRHNNVTTTVDGFMSKEDKIKLNGVANNANNYIHPSDANTRHVSDTQIASWNAKPTVNDVDNKIKTVIGAAPEALDTLKEIGDALGNDANFAATMTTQLAGKAALVHDHNDLYYTETESDAKYLGKLEKADSAKSADSVTWANVSGKPATFTPTSHTHDDRYYTETESDGRFLGKTAKAESAKVSDSVAWDNVTGKPSTYSPSSHNHDDRYFTESESDSRYLRTNVKNLVSIDDFNDILNFGLYRVGSTTTMTNAPYTGAIYGTLEVFEYTSTSETIQIFIDFRSDVYTRFNKSGSGWLPWSKSFSTTNKPSWDDILNKPSATDWSNNHNHDGRYYTESEVNNLVNARVSNTDYLLTTITKNLNVSTDWLDTGITGSNLSTGSYMVQISGMASSTGFWTEIFTGTMSWFSTATNSSDTDEILLHKAGHASSGKTLYLRTIRVAGTGGLMKLQIAATGALGASDYTFKFRKLI